MSAADNAVVPVSRVQHREEYQRVEYLLQVRVFGVGCATAPCCHQPLPLLKRALQVTLPSPFAAMPASHRGAKPQGVASGEPSPDPPVRQAHSVAVVLGVLGECWRSALLQQGARRVQQGVLLA